MPRVCKQFVVETVISSSKHGKQEKFEYMINCDEPIDEESLLRQMHREFLEVFGVDSSENTKKKRKRQKFRAEKILSFSTSTSTFIVKWANKDDIAFVHVDEAKKKFPKLVIQYFRERLNWFPIKT